MKPTFSRSLLLLLFALTFLLTHRLQAQTPPAPAPTAPLALTRPQAIDYALKNRASLTAQRRNEGIAKARVGQTRAQGLPQLTGAAGITDNIKLQQSLVDFSALGGGAGELNPFTLTPQQLADLNASRNVALTPTYATPVAGAPVPFAFGLPYTGTASASLTQLLFDGSFLVGLKASKIYQELAVKQTGQSEVDVVEQVSKAYYAVLVNAEQLRVLARNVARVDTLLRQTQETYRVGLIEHLDVERTQVSYNNLLVAQEQAQRGLVLSYALLKFQLGLDQRQELTLLDPLDDTDLDQLRRLAAAPTVDFPYTTRIEYSVLQTQRDLAELNTRRFRAGYLPRLSASASYGLAGSDRSLGGLLEFRGTGSRNDAGFRNQNWFGFASVGLNLQIPIFDGLLRRYSIQEAKLNALILEDNATTLRQNIDLQLAQGRASLQKALGVLRTQQANLDLAGNVARVSKIKFQEGVGSNVELSQAETDLLTAQTNYYDSLLRALTAKVDLQKATGTLYQPPLLPATK